MKRSFMVLMLASFSLLVTARNTVKGLGRDIESVGEAGGKAIG